MVNQTKEIRKEFKLLLFLPSSPSNQTPPKCHSLFIFIFIFEKVLSLVESSNDDDDFVEIALWAPAHCSPKSNSEAQVERPNIVPLPTLIVLLKKLFRSAMSNVNNHLVDEENVNHWIF